MKHNFLTPTNVLFEHVITNKHGVCVCVCVCCVCVCVCVCVCTSIHCEGFICLDQLGYQETDQRYFVEDVNFLCQAPSSLPQNATPKPPNQLLYPACILEAGKATT